MRVSLTGRTVSRKARQQKRRAVRANGEASSCGGVTEHCRQRRRLDSLAASLSEGGTQIASTPGSSMWPWGPKATGADPTQAPQESAGQMCVASAEPEEARDPGRRAEGGSEPFSDIHTGRSMERPLRRCSIVVGPTGRSPRVRLREGQSVFELSMASCGGWSSAPSHGSSGSAKFNVAMSSPMRLGNGRVTSDAS